MRFERHLLLERKGRTEEIDLNTFIDIATRAHMDNFQWFISTGQALYRGHISINSHYGYVKPKDFDRVSANTSNYYTMLLDNSKKWNKFPKRSKSLICGNQFKAAYGSMSERYVVIPKDGSKIGICPTDDFWDAFHMTYTGSDMSEFNQDLEWIIEAFGMNRPKDINTLRKQVKLIDSQVAQLDDMDGYDAMRRQTRVNSTNDLWQMMKMKQWTLSEVLDYIIDPKENNFRLIDHPKNLPTGRSRECWTDGDSLLLKKDAWDFYMADITNAFEGR